MINDRPRYAQLDFPPYSYVPGHAPHPVSDPAGHMFGETHEQAAALRPNKWQASTEYLYGIDLFNHGYYWEAHEAWESLWHAAGRRGITADFLKGLIKLAAAGVKAREGNPQGVLRHAGRAKELISSVNGAEYNGLNLGELINLADRLLETAETFTKPQPMLLLDAVIRLHED